MTKKSLFIKTYGCQMNVYDSEKMETLLKPHGFEISDKQLDADLVILNTCHIREKAAEKVYSELGKIPKNNQTVVVAGCVAQAEGEEIFKRAKNVDIVVGPQSYHNLPKLLEELKRSKKWVMDLDFDETRKFDDINLPDKFEHSAFLTVQEGCDKFCHFCCVPYTRGKEYSRKVSDIYREGLFMASKGVREITLLGQNVSAFSGKCDQEKSYTLAQMIRKIALIPGVERIRYVTSHPKDMTDEELFEVHGDEKKLMPYLHLPIQSGSDRVLKAMNRGHTADFYLKIIERFRKHRKDIAFSSDFIVGYPGETEDDFQRTMEVVAEVGYTQSFSFKYSPRPGTPAAVAEDQVPEEIKDDRLQRLQKLLHEQQLIFNKKMVGKNMKILVNKPGKYPNQLIGKSPYLQSVVIEGNEADIGQFINVKILDANINSLNAVRV